MTALTRRRGMMAASDDSPKNLIDPNRFVPGSLNSSGEPDGNTGYVTSDYYVPVQNGDVMVFNGIYTATVWCCYDANKNFLSGTRRYTYGNAATIKISNITSAYFRFSLRKGAEKTATLYKNP